MSCKYLEHNVCVEFKQQKLLGENDEKYGAFAWNSHLYDQESSGTDFVHVVAA